VTVLPWIVKPASPCPWEPRTVIRPLSLMEVAAGGVDRVLDPGKVPKSVEVALSGHSTAVALPVANDVAEPTASALPLIASGAELELAFARSPGQPRDSSFVVPAPPQEALLHLGALLGRDAEDGSVLVDAEQFRARAADDREPVLRGSRRRARARRSPARRALPPR
jgi:hypothetical protein